MVTIPLKLLLIFVAIVVVVTRVGVGFVEAWMHQRRHHRIDRALASRDLAAIPTIAKAVMLARWHTVPDLNTLQTMFRDMAAAEFSLAETIEIFQMVGLVRVQTQPPASDSQPAPPISPSPRNRVLRENETPCRVCGSGKADHETRDHKFQ